MAGKGVDVAAILGAQLNTVPESGTDMQWIPLGIIQSNPRNFYPQPDDTELADLMESIQANGLLEPPTVVPDETQQTYRLISGHSRMRAVRRLHDQHPLDDRWVKVLCRVLPQMTENEEVCAVIEANRQRIKSNAILQQEAERLTALYVARREAGEELPGRIRDRVAEAMQISKTKLSNLNAIKKGLRVPGFIRDWEQQRLTESAALEIARMDADVQYRLLDWSIDQNVTLTLPQVKKFGTIWICCKHQCPHTDGLCPNASRMYDAKYRLGCWNCPGCCEQCLNKETCATACQYIERPQQPVAEIKGRNQVLEDPRLKNLGETLGKRLAAARTAAGMERKEFAESLDFFPATYSAWENGNLPGGDRIPALALALGVSTDYLFGLTDETNKFGESPAVSSCWSPLDKDHWPPDGALVILSYENELGGSGYQLARCAGSWADQYPFFDPNSDLTVRDFEEYGFDRWMPFDEVQRHTGN